MRTARDFYSADAVDGAATGAGTSGWLRQHAGEGLVAYPLSEAVKPADLQPIEEVVGLEVEEANERAPQQTPELQNEAVTHSSVDDGIAEEAESYNSQRRQAVAPSTL